MDKDWLADAAWSAEQSLAANERALQITQEQASGMADAQRVLIAYEWIDGELGEQPLVRGRLVPGPYGLEVPSGSEWGFPFRAGDEPRAACEWEAMDGWSLIPWHRVYRLVGEELG